MKSHLYAIIILSMLYVIAGIGGVIMRLIGLYSFWQGVASLVFLALGILLTYSGIRVFRIHTQKILNQPVFHYLCSIVPIAIIVQVINCTVNVVREPNVPKILLIPIGLNFLTAAAISITSIYTLRDYKDLKFLKLEK